MSEAFDEIVNVPSQRLRHAGGPPRTVFVDAFMDTAQAATSFSMLSRGRTMPERSSASSRLRLAATVTLVVGLIFVGAGVEALATFNSCVADPACLPDAGALNVGAFFAILAVGIALVIAPTLRLSEHRAAKARLIPFGLYDTDPKSELLSQREGGHSVASFSHREIRLRLKTRRVAVAALFNQANL